MSETFANLWHSLVGVDFGSTDYSVVARIDIVSPRYKKVIVNDRTTIVLWNDGSKTRSTCAPEDTFDAKIGFAVCLMKKLYPKKQRDRILKRVEVQG